MRSVGTLWRSSSGAPETYPSVDAAWRRSLATLRADGQWIESVQDRTSVGSDFGRRARPFKELIGHSFSISNPRERIVLSKVRRLNFTFAFANFIWTLSGSSRVEMIARYNERGITFSDDGVTLASAFGPKLFGKAPTQFERAAILMAADPTTRRAMIGLFDDNAIEAHSRDISCALGIQFLKRRGALHCVVFMRSQSALMVMPYDLFLFTMLHECMAAWLGLPLGVYKHISASLHYYGEEEHLVDQILREGTSPKMPAMPVMPEFSDATRKRILNAENLIRDMASSRESIPKIIFEVATSGLSDYWITMFALFFGDGPSSLRHRF